MATGTSTSWPILGAVMVCKSCQVAGQDLPAYPHLVVIHPGQAGPNMPSHRGEFFGTFPVYRYNPQTNPLTIQ